MQIQEIKFSQGNKFFYYFVGCTVEIFIIWSWFVYSVKGW